MHSCTKQTFAFHYWCGGPASVQASAKPMHSLTPMHLHICTHTHIYPPPLSLSLTSFHKTRTHAHPQLYETDIRVPLLVRGPGVRPGFTVTGLVSHVDLAVTFIAMGGGSRPEQMDGTSWLPLVHGLLFACVCACGVCA